MILQQSKNESGQTLVIIVFVMVIALAVGIGISNRFVSNLRISSVVDSSGRAVSVAEALVERLLIVDNSTLEDYINFGSCGSNCTLTIPGIDGVDATATATLSYEGNTSDPLQVPLTVSETVEVNLDTYNDLSDSWVCWDDISGFPGSAQPSIVAMHVFGNSGSYSMNTYAYNAISSTNTSNGFDTATALYGYDNCITISGQNNPRLLRLRPIYNSVTAYFIPDSGVTVPSQGIRIEAEGSVLDTRKTVTVIKSATSLPVDFDFAIISRSETEPLSNTTLSE